MFNLSISLNSFYFYLFLLYFFLSGFYDLKKKTVPTILHIIFMLSGLPFFINFQVRELSCQEYTLLIDILLRFIPGIILTAISIISGGNIGIGDAIFITVSAFYIPFNYILMLAISGFLSAFMVSMAILIYGKISGKDYHNMTLPFIPLMFPGLFLFLNGF